MILMDYHDSGDIDRHLLHDEEILQCMLEGIYQLREYIDIHGLSLMHHVEKGYYLSDTFNLTDYNGYISIYSYSETKTLLKHKVTQDRFILTCPEDDLTSLLLIPLSIRKQYSDKTYSLKPKVGISIHDSLYTLDITTSQYSKSNSN